MQNRWFSAMFFKKELERRCGLNKSMYSFGPIENTDEIEDSNWNHDDYLYLKFLRENGLQDIHHYFPNDYFGVKDSNGVFVRDSNGDNSPIYLTFDYINLVFSDDGNYFRVNNLGLSKLKRSFLDPSYVPNESRSENTDSSNDSSNNSISWISWNNFINYRVNRLVESEICIETSMVSDSDNGSDSYISRYICGESRNNGEPEGSDGEPEGSEDWDDETPDWDDETPDWDWDDETEDDPTEDRDRETERWYFGTEGSDSETEGSDGEPEWEWDVGTEGSDSETEGPDDEPEWDVGTEGSDSETEGPDDEPEWDVGTEGWDRETEGWDFGTEGWGGATEASAGIRTHAKDSDLILEESSNDILGVDRDYIVGVDRGSKYRHLWVQCDNCYGLNYKKYFKSKMYICEHCEWHLKMNSSDRIDLSIDPDTWDPMDEDMASLDPIEFHSDSEDESYQDRLDSYQTETGIPEAVQTGIGELNGIPVAVGVMDFEFIGGSMASVVGEKITRLIEYATNQFLPLIIVCASGGARMQEGSVSLMQMAKISSALYDYQVNKKLFYVSILASPTTGGVTASFGMLGDIIIAEPNAYIAFAGKRVIEQTLNITVPEGFQETEYLFEKGLFDLIVPRNLLKSVLTELFKLHAIFPLTQNSNQNEIER